ncbi:hypothetical protein Tco_0095778, partial [Tanacetum coccineum]
MRKLVNSIKKNTLAVLFEGTVRVIFGLAVLFNPSLVSTADGIKDFFWFMGLGLSEILGYQMSLESLEVILKTHEKNEYAWGDKYEQMEYDLKLRDLKLEEKQKELDQVLIERDDFKRYSFLLEDLEAVPADYVPAGH